MFIKKILPNNNDWASPINAFLIIILNFNLFTFAVGFMLCHQVLSQDQPNKLWISALESSWVIALFRDEVIYIHAYIQNLFDGIKGYGKRVSEVKDCYNQAIQKA